jgi:hypothetical protein
MNLMRQGWMSAAALIMLGGCSGGSSKKYDLPPLMGKILRGMTLDQLTWSIGEPSSFKDVEGGQILRYEGKDGGYILVTMEGGRVRDALRYEAKTTRP